MAFNSYIYEVDIKKGETYRVVSSDIEQILTTNGVLRPKEQVNVGAQVNGRLNKLHVKEGEYVKQGQLLAEIDPTIAQSDVDNAKSELDTALVQKRLTSISAEQSMRDYNRQKKMLTSNATTLSDLEASKTKYNSDRAQLEVNEIKIEQAEVKLKTARANLEYTRIRSPIDGVVLGILTQEGQTIVSSQSAPTILVVANLDVMNVNIKISEMDVLKTRVGMPLWFTVAAASNIRYNGTLENIQKIPEEMLQNSSGDLSISKKNATYYNGNFDVLNDKHKLSPAMSVQVSLIVCDKKNVVVIPTDYLGAHVGANNYIVNLLRNKKIERKEVEAGIRTAKKTEIIKGLEEGDEIVKGDY